MTDPDYRQPIEYRDGRLDKPTRRRFWLEAVGGCLVGVVAVAVNGANLVLSNIHYTSSTQPTSWQTTQFQWQGPLNCSAICLAAVALAIFFRCGVVIAHSDWER